MSRDITEADWKIWKALRLRCIDQFCAQTFDQIQKLSDRDREIEQLFDPLTRSRAIMQLINLHRSGLVSDDDISRFSEALQSICHQTRAL